jgi:hypothetical protein
MGNGGALDGGGRPVGRGGPPGGGGPPIGGGGAARAAMVASLIKLDVVGYWIDDRCSIIADKTWIERLIGNEPQFSRFVTDTFEGSISH